MDVGSPMTWVRLFFIAAMGAAGLAGPAWSDQPRPEVLVHGLTLTLTESCDLHVAGPKETPRVLDLGLPAGASCLFTVFSGTNVPHLERFGRHYVLMVESCAAADHDEVSSYRGLAVLADGDVRLGGPVRHSWRCPTDRDRMAFEVVAAALGLPR